MATIFKSTTLSAAVDDTTPANKAFFTSILGEMANGFFKLAADANPFAGFDDSRVALGFGAGGASAMDVYAQRDAAGILAARNAADSGYAIIRGAAPVGGDDLVTKTYGDANYLQTSFSGALLDADLSATASGDTYPIFSTDYANKKIIIRHANTEPYGIQLLANSASQFFLVYGTGIAANQYAALNIGQMTMRSTQGQSFRIDPKNTQLTMDGAKCKLEIAEWGGVDPGANSFQFHVDYSLYAGAHDRYSFGAQNLNGYVWKLSTLGGQQLKVLATEPGNADTGMVWLYVYDNGGTIEIRAKQSDGTVDTVKVLT